MIDELSIVIPTLNEASCIGDLLKSLLLQTYIGKLQVVVVDGHSTDNTAAVIRSFARSIPDLLLITAKCDIGHQRNVGAKHSKYRYLLFLDADVLLPPKMLEQLIAKVRFNGSFIAGVMHTGCHMNLADRLFQLTAYPFVFLCLIRRIPVTIGDFILTTSDNHNRIGGFVEGSLLGEDVDYGLRSVSAGAEHRFYMRPQVIASYRRAHQMGRVRLLLLWSRGFRHVLKHGPIFAGEGYVYPFGQHNNDNAKNVSID